MALDMSVSHIIDLIGHDGGELLASGEEPTGRRSFHIQEIIHVAYELGYGVIGFEALPINNLGIVISYPEGNANRLAAIMSETTGIITGVGKSGLRHVVAWNGKLIYDPNGQIYPIDQFQVDTYYLIFKIKSKDYK